MFCQCQKNQAAYSSKPPWCVNLILTSGNFAPEITHYASLGKRTEAAITGPGRFVESYLEVDPTLGVHITPILETHRPCAQICLMQTGVH